MGIKTRFTSVFEYNLTFWSLYTLLIVVQSTLLIKCQIHWVTKVLEAKLLIQFNFYFNSHTLCVFEVDSHQTCELNLNSHWWWEFTVFPWLTLYSDIFWYIQAYYDIFQYIFWHVNPSFFTLLIIMNVWSCGSPRINYLKIEMSNFICFADNISTQDIFSFFNKIDSRTPKSNMWSHTLVWSHVGCLHLA